MIKIKLLLIGNELLSGKVIDKNGHSLALILQSYGLDLSLMTLLPDNEILISEFIKSEMEDESLLICSGGLGPTKDDITKSALALALNVPIKKSQHAAEVTLKNYERKGLEWKVGQNLYDQVPEKCTPLNNPKGLAPGLFYREIKKRKALLLLPGVPKEFAAMLRKEIEPLLKEVFSFSKKSKDTLTIRTVSIPEEKIFYGPDLTLWEDLERFGQVASYPQTMGVDILITEVKNKKAALERIQNSPIASHVWNTDQRSLPKVLIDELRLKRKTLSFAESCTGGLASSKITDVVGSSEVFLGGVISYAEELKINLLELAPETISSYGVVSIEVVKQMALGCLKVTGSDYTVSFTGIAGPGGGTQSRPVGTVAIAWGERASLEAKLYNFTGSRSELKELFTQKGLFNLLKKIRA